MANKKFLNPINLVNLSSDPASGSEGDIYYNTTSDVVKVYANGSWVAIGSSGSGSNITVSTTAPSTPETGDAWYKNDTGEFYVYDGTYWVEVNGVIEGLSQEQIQDYVAPLFTHANHTNASVTYEDASNELHIDVISAPSAGYTGTVKHDVRLNGSIAKGQAVYVSSSDGTNMIVSKASNASEATSSKTLGLLESGGSNNNLVKVVTEGLLAGLDTSTAGTEGDPVWLGTDGNLIYGLTNKPVAPAHLVFIGIVTRKNSNNGEIFVKVQNGFELSELHTVLLEANGSVADNELLAYDLSSGLWKNQTSVEAGLIDTSVTAQTKTGNLTISGIVTAETLDLNEARITAVGNNISVNTPVLIDTFDGTVYRSAEYLVQLSQAGSYTTSKILIVHNGTDVSLTEYGTVSIGSDIDYTLSSSFSGNNLEISLQCPQATSSTVSFKYSKTLFDV